MKGKKFDDYSVEELAGDQEFISIVKRLDKTPEWEQFLCERPGSKEEMIQAKKIILLFRTNEEIPPDEKKIKVWESINRFNKGQVRHARIARRNIYLRAAAAVLVFIITGSLLYRTMDQRNRQFRFSQVQTGQNLDYPLLVLPDGNQVDLGKEEAKVTVLREQEAIQVNDDSIISSISKPDKPVQLNEIIVPFGRKSNMILADGTKVWLNAGSRFAFPTKFQGEIREVFLEGEGYFEVAKDSKHPFIISTNDLNIEVLGTKFNVSAYDPDDFVETVLFEGSVQVFEKKGLFSRKVIMTPNQKSTYRKSNRRIVLNPESNPETYKGWIEGWYLFSNEKPELVLKKLERYYNIQFEYDPLLLSSSLPVSGKLDLKESLDEVLTVVSKVTKIDYQITGNRVILSGK